MRNSMSRLLNWSGAPPTPTKPFADTTRDQADELRDSLR